MNIQALKLNKIYINIQALKLKLKGPKTSFCLKLKCILILIFFFSMNFRIEYCYRRTIKGVNLIVCNAITAEKIRALNNL